MGDKRCVMRGGGCTRTANTVSTYHRARLLPADGSSEEPRSIPNERKRRKRKRKRSRTIILRNREHAMIREQHGSDPHLPVRLALVDQGVATQDLHIRDLAHLQWLIAQLHDIQGIVVSREVCTDTSENRCMTISPSSPEAGGLARFGGDTDSCAGRSPSEIPRSGG